MLPLSTFALIDFAHVVPYPCIRYLHGSGGAACGKNFLHQGKPSLCRSHGQLPPCLTADVQTETLSRRATRGYNESERDNLIPG